MNFLTKPIYSYIDLFFIVVCFAAIDNGHLWTSILMFISWTLFSLALDYKGKDNQIEEQQK